MLPPRLPLFSLTACLLQCYYAFWLVFLWRLHLLAPCLQPGRPPIARFEFVVWLRSLLCSGPQAQISRWSYTVMGAIFALSTPLGVAIGLGIQATYHEHSPNSLGVQGVFDSLSAGTPLAWG